MTPAELKIQNQLAARLKQFPKVSRLAIEPRRDLVSQAWPALRTGLPMLAVDAVVAWLALTLVALLPAPWDAQLGELGPSPLVGAGTMLVVMFVAGNYPGSSFSAHDEARRISLAVGVLGLVQAVRIASAGMLGLTELLGLVAASLVLIGAALGARRVARQFLAKCSWWGERALVVGPRPSADGVADALRAYRHQGLIPVELPRCYDELCATMPEYRQLVRSARWMVLVGPRDDVSIPRSWWGTRVFEAPHASSKGFALARRPFPAVALPGRRVTRHRYSVLPCALKRAIDITAALLGLIVAAPLLVTIALAIKLTSPGPILFGHPRIGRYGRTFPAWKFRTMVTNGEEVLQNHLHHDPEAREEWATTQKLRDDPRVTSIGGFLRRWSLDELPQLWNILNGSMSLVGPRPIVTDEIPKYGPWFQDYAAVRPGLTGLWQVSIRTDTTYDERVQLDAYYVEHWTPWLDLLILARTATVVVRGEGAF